MKDQFDSSTRCDVEISRLTFMRRHSRQFFGIIFSFLLSHGAFAAETYVKEPMPPGFRVEMNELEGAVYADERGKTLYNWAEPAPELHIMGGGEAKGQPRCYNDKYTNVLDAGSRPTCVEMWPPVFASAESKPVGKWSVVERKDGTLQWAYEGYPLYTSALDQKPGDTQAGTRQVPKTSGYPGRKPIGPTPDVPPGFTVHTVPSGRLLTTSSGFTLYYFGGEKSKARCSGECLRGWNPVIAPELAVAQGEWSVVTNADGMRQWAFRNKPLFTYSLDRYRMDLWGEDTQGWHGAFTTKVALPPKFQLQVTSIGEVVADARGVTIYKFACNGDDAPDQLLCEHPDSSNQFSRLMLCGYGDPDRCAQRWPYVHASADDKSFSQLWTVIEIDSKTGHRVKPSTPGGVRVWAFNGRPLYYYSEDKRAGDTLGDGFGVHNAGKFAFRTINFRKQFPDQGDD